MTFFENMNASHEHWAEQKTITVRFEDSFDQNYQCTLKEYVVTHSKSARDRRLDYAVPPPDKLSVLLEEEPVDLPVPADQESASRILKELYKQGHNKTISRSFEKFRVVLSPSNLDIICLRTWLRSTWGLMDVNVINPVLYAALRSLDN